MQRKCPQCGEIKEEVEFPKNKSTRSGIHCWCKVCSRKSNKNVYTKNLDYYKKKSTEYQTKNNFKYQKMWSIKNIGSKKYSSLSSSLKMRKKIELLGISRKEFVDWYNLQEKKCCYCAISEEEFKIKKLRGNTGMSLNIDRLNPKKRYEIGNIALCCPICNTMKSNFFTPEETREIATHYKIREKILAL